MRSVLAAIFVLALTVPVDAQLLPWRQRINQRLRALEQQSQRPAPSPQQQAPIIIVPPYQQLPIGGQPKQPLPIGGDPKQPLPIGGDPKQPLPVPGQPKQPLPAPGTPQQQLPLVPNQPPPQIGDGGQPRQTLPQVAPLNGGPQQYSGRVLAIWRRGQYYTNPRR